MNNRKGKAKVLSIQEFRKTEKLIELTMYKERNRAILYLSFGLGLRAGEIRNLTFGDVIGSDGKLKELVRLTITKSNKQRDIYLTNPKLREVLMDHIKTAKKKFYKKSVLPILNEDPLFASQKGHKFLNNHFVRLICSFFKSAGIENAKSHSGRRTFITLKIDEGHDLKAIADLVGHTDINATAQYHQSNPTRLKKIAERSIF
jgi:integrase/recombinase XerD